MTDPAELRAFVAEAHRNGYATGGATRAEDGSKVLSYGRDRWHYRDRYFGSREFVGSEVVSHEGDPVWGMSYDGYLVDDAADREAVYEFLRTALRAVPEETPYRGPPTFREGEFSYRAEVEGTIDRFEGRESIHRDGERRYTGRFSGGRIR